MMHEVMQKQPLAVALVGLVLVVVGSMGANSQSLSGNPVLLIFDIGAIAGWILLVWGLIIWFKSRKARKNDGA